MNMVGPADFLWDDRRKVWTGHDVLKGVVTELIPASLSTNGLVEVWDNTGATGWTLEVWNWLDSHIGENEKVNLLYNVLDNKWYAFKRGETIPVSWNCVGEINGPRDCIDPGDGTGAYAVLGDCRANCCSKACFFGADEISERVNLVTGTQTGTGYCSCSVALGTIYLEYNQDACTYESTLLSPAGSPCEGFRWAFFVDTFSHPGFYQYWAVLGRTNSLLFPDHVSSDLFFLEIPVASGGLCTLPKVLPYIYSRYFFTNESTTEEKLCNLDQVTITPYVWSYNCISGSCVDPGDGTGAFATFVECQGTCV